MNLLLTLTPDHAETVGHALLTLRRDLAAKIASAEESAGIVSRLAAAEGRDASERAAHYRAVAGDARAKLERVEAVRWLLDAAPGAGEVAA